MSDRKRVLAMVMAGALLLAAGLGPGLGRPARARPEPGAGPPGVTIPYPGHLALASPSDGAGQPVADGAYAFTFTLYEAETGGEPLWSETQDGVAVQGGAFTALLGSATPLSPDLLGSGERWLAVAVRGPGEADFTPLTPRQGLSATPAAQASQSSGPACPHDHFGETWAGSASGHGLAIQNSGTGQGLLVYHAGGPGVQVYSAGYHGVQVDWAGNDGVHVGSVEGDGVHVDEAGNPSRGSGSLYSSGFEVEGAEGNGLFIGHADLHGVSVAWAGRDGLYVGTAEEDGVEVGWAEEDGVEVRWAGGDGVVATSRSDTHYGGAFYNSAAGGGGLYAAGGDNAAPDLVLGASLSDSGDDGRIYSASGPELNSSDILLFSNDEVHIHLDEDGDEGGTFRIYNGDDVEVFSVDEAGAVTFGSEAGAYGPRAAYAAQATGNWLEDFGAAHLVDGQATVAIEPVFAQMVSLGEYHVFLTPLGDCPLYIADKTPTSFTVKAMGGQTCSIAFDYRLVARRLGYEEARLEPPDTGLEEDDE